MISSPRESNCLQLSLRIVSYGWQASKFGTLLLRRPGLLLPTHVSRRRALRKEAICLPCCQRIWRPCQNNIILLCNFWHWYLLHLSLGMIYDLSGEHFSSSWSLQYEISEAFKGLCMFQVGIRAFGTHTSPSLPFPPLHHLHLSGHCDTQFTQFFREREKIM